TSPSIPQGAEADRMADQLAVLGVLVVPLLAAVVVWALGPRQAPAVRAVSAAASVVTLALALWLSVRYVAHINRAGAPLGRSAALEARGTFIPEFVPGSTPEQPDQTTWVLLPLQAPTTTLKTALSDADKTLEVASSVGFPIGGRFSVLVGGERIVVER